MRAFCIPIFIALGMSVAAAQDAPSSGLLYNTHETHSLTYDCRLDGRDLECSFIQTRVRKKAKPEELADALGKARASYPDFQRDTAKQCQGVEPLYEAVVLGRPPAGANLQKFNEASRRMHSVQKADLGKFVASWREVCRNPSEANYLEFSRAAHERETRTCSVNSYGFKQRFKRVDSTGPWVVADQPSGPCGVVNVSRFEKDLSVGAALAFWRYYAKKVVTNPKGEFFPGASCSKLDEQEYLYDWRSQENYLGCDYINFGAL